jgi:hypothetical protein
MVVEEREVNFQIATPEFIEARKPIEKWFDMYDRGVITKTELVSRITDYTLSFKPKEPADAS